MAGAERTIEDRLAALEATVAPTYVHLVWHDMRPVAAFRSEAEAEALVVQLLRGNEWRCLASACRFKLLLQ